MATYLGDYLPRLNANMLFAMGAMRESEKLRGKSDPYTLMFVAKSFYKQDISMLIWLFSIHIFLDWYK